MYIKTKLKINIELIKSDDPIMQEKMNTINEQTIAKYKFEQKQKRIYGEINFKRLNALREQTIRAKLKNDVIALEHAQTEIQKIQDNPHIEHKKVKLSKEEKTKIKSAQKRAQREARKKLIGDEAYRKEMADEKRKQKAKKELLNELGKN